MSAEAFGDAGALAFLDELLRSCGPLVQDLSGVRIADLAGVLLGDMAGNPDPVLQQPGKRVWLTTLAARHRPLAEREHVDGIDVFDVRAWPQEPSARVRFLAAFRREVEELRQRIAPASDEQRISPAASPQAIALGLLAEGRSLTDVAKTLRIRRQDLYEKNQWAIVLHYHRTRMGARRQSRDDRAGRNPDNWGNGDDG